MDIAVINDIIQRNETTPEVLVNDIKLELLKGNQAPCPVYHHFSPGLYIREINMAAGLCVVGHKHKTDHLNIFLQGKIQMIKDDGTVNIIQAPMLFTGKPGRKCGYMLEDVVWLNVFPTSETNIEKLEEMFLDKSDPTDQIKVKIDPVVKTACQKDYKQMLQEYGFTEQEVRRQSEISVDQIPFPPGSYGVGVFQSPIEGWGLFATADIPAGEIIAPARIGNCRTPAGRYTNHSGLPNAVMTDSANGLDLVALRYIYGNKGGQLGEEILINYRHALELKGVKPCHQQ